MRYYLSLLWKYREIESALERVIFQHSSQKPNTNWWFRVDDSWFSFPPKFSYIFLKIEQWERARKERQEEERFPSNHMAQRSVKKEQERKWSATKVSVFVVHNWGREAVGGRAASSVAKVNSVIFSIFLPPPSSSSLSLIFVSIYFDQKKKRIHRNRRHLWKRRHLWRPGSGQRMQQ